MLRLFMKTYIVGLCRPLCVCVCVCVCVLGPLNMQF
jgi:hypothetical protein